MLDRRRPRPSWVVAAVLVALLGPGLPAHGDPSDPSPTEIDQAHRAVEQARRSVQSLQVQAENAAEAYNGARSRAQKAQRASDQAAAKAARADAAQSLAQGVAAGARAAADTAELQVDRAKESQRAAEAEVAAAQRTLNRMAVGAYKTGGQLGVVGSLLRTSDPTALARGQAYVNRVGSYQRGVVVELAEAKQRAQSAAQVAAAASAAAAVSAHQAEDALARAEQAQRAAATARDSASRAARDAQRSVYLAAQARGRALYLVARAESALGTAEQRAARLERAAAEARRQAAGVRPGKASSAAAQAAMDAAMEQIGVPYSWGGGDENGPTYGFAQGAGTKGFDCSGLTLYAYAQAGIRLDHYSQSQWDRGKRVSGALQPGDLLFFAYDTSDPSTIHHVSMYLGNGRMIEAPYTGEVVRVVSSRRSGYIGATRPWAA